MSWSTRAKHVLVSEPAVPTHSKSKQGANGDVATYLAVDSLALLFGSGRMGRRIGELAFSVWLGRAMTLVANITVKRMAAGGTVLPVRPSILRRR